MTILSAKVPKLAAEYQAQSGRQVFYPIGQLGGILCDARATIDDCYSLPARITSAELKPTSIGTVLPLVAEATMGKRKRNVEFKYEVHTPIPFLRSLGYQVKSGQIFDTRQLNGTTLDFLVLKEEDEGRIQERVIGILGGKKEP